MRLRYSAMMCTSHFLSEYLLKNEPQAQEHEALHLVDFEASANLAVNTKLWQCRFQIGTWIGVTQTSHIMMNELCNRIVLIFIELFC